MNDRIIYWAEQLAPNRARLICDVVIDGQVALSYPVGSPAPLDVVRRREREVVLGAV